MSSRNDPSHHQSELKWRELQCLSTTKITKYRGGGLMRSCHPFCSTSFCAKANKAGLGR